MELTIQLAIIMIGNQAINTILEMAIPFLVKIYKTYYLKKSYSEEVISCNQWTEDYKLSDLEPGGLFTEYLEMGKFIIILTDFKLNLKFYSATIWIRNNIRNSIPISPFVCPFK